MFEVVMELAAAIIAGCVALLLVGFLVYAWAELIKYLAEVF